MEPSLKTLKRLFALSQNRCAFPECQIPIVEETGTVTGIVCHIKARSKGGPRYDPEQTDEGRHSFPNLLLLCARHSRVIDSEPDQYSVDFLLEMKRLQERKGTVEISQSDARIAELLLKAYRSIHITAGGHVMIDSPGSVLGSSVIIKSQRKRFNIVPPVGSLASSLSRRNYVKHLIDRYNEFASQQPGRTFRHAAIYANIKRRYGAKWDMIPLQTFDDLVSFLHDRIDRTMLGSMNRAKGVLNYSDFAEYRTKYEGKP